MKFARVIYPKKAIASLLSMCMVATSLPSSAKAGGSVWQDRPRMSVPTLPLPTPASLFNGRNDSSTPADVLAVVAPFGRISAVSKAVDANTPVVVHIQDVHRNAEAQANISKAIQALGKQNSIRLIALEGAFGPVSVDALQSVNRPDLLDPVSDHLLQTNQIVGAMHGIFSMHKKTPTVVGIDDASHHAANVRAYLKSRAAKEQTAQRLQEALRDIEKQKSTLFSPGLLAFDRTVSAYHSGQLSFGEYAQRVTREFAGPEAQSFVEALRLEKSLDFHAVEAERSQLLSQLVNTMDTQQARLFINKSAAFRSGELTSSEFYRYLEQCCAQYKISLNSFGVLKKYIRYAELAGQINSEVLFDELMQAEQAGYETLSISNMERRWVARSRFVHLAQKLVTFSLTEREWRDFKHVRDAQRAWLTAIKCDLSSYEDFYRQAEFRDSAMANNFMAALKQAPRSTSGPSVSVLVTGGFHSRGINTQLKNSGQTVVSFVPKITSVDTDNGSAYLNAFAQEKTPLERLFEGHALFLSEPVAPSWKLQGLIPLLMTGLGSLTKSIDSPRSFFRQAAGLQTSPDVTVDVASDGDHATVQLTPERAASQPLSLTMLTEQQPSGRRLVSTSITNSPSIRMISWVAGSVAAVAALYIYGSFALISDRLGLLAIVMVAAVVHEVAHGGVALYFGDDSAKSAGRLTVLRFWRHFDSVGTLVLVASTLVIGVPMGWMKKVPVNFTRLTASQSKRVLWAGPLSNFALAGVLAMVFASAPAMVAPFGAWFVLAIKINLMLGAFNLLPIGMLDGRGIFLQRRISQSWYLRGSPTLAACAAVLFGIATVAGYCEEIPLQKYLKKKFDRASDTVKDKFIELFYVELEKEYGTDRETIRRTIKMDPTFIYMKLEKAAANMTGAFGIAGEALSKERKQRSSTLPQKLDAGSADHAIYHAFTDSFGFQLNDDSDPVAGQLDRDNNYSPEHVRATMRGKLIGQLANDFMRGADRAAIEKLVDETTVEGISLIEYVYAEIDRTRVIDLFRFINEENPYTESSVTTGAPTKSTTHIHGYDGGATGAMSGLYLLMMLGAGVLAGITGVPLLGLATAQSPPAKPKTIADLLRLNNISTQDAEFLNKMVKDATTEFRESPPVIGRSDDKKKIRGRLRQPKTSERSLLLTGPAGIGKTSMLRFIADAFPEKTILALKPGALGNVAERGTNFSSLLALLEKFGDDVFLFVDEFHSLLSGPGGNYDRTLGDILKPYTSPPKVTVIGATTTGEFRKFIEQDDAVVRRFEVVKLEQPSVDDAISMVRSRKEEFEQLHGVAIDDDAVEAAVRGAARYLPQKSLPNSAFKLIDATVGSLKNRRDALRDLKSEFTQKIQLAMRDLIRLQKQAQSARRDRDIVSAHNRLVGALDAYHEVMVQLSKMPVVESLQITEADVLETLESQTGIPVSETDAEDANRYLNLDKQLAEKVIGQPEATMAVAAAIRQSKAGMRDPKRPMGVFLFAGPTGVGKTEFAKGLQDILFGDGRELIRIDMTEYMEEYSTTRLVGAPPGYVGHDDGGQLTNAVKEHPYSVVLLDEVTKAHKNVLRILMQVLDDGRLTDGKGETVDFKNTIIIMTSNIGMDSIQGPLAGQIALLEQAETPEAADQICIDIRELMRDAVMKGLNKKYAPEEVKRIDNIVVFNILTEPVAMGIAPILLNKELAAFKTEKKINFVFDPSVYDDIVEHGFDYLYGARPMRSYIGRSLMPVLTNFVLRQMADGKKLTGATISVTFKDGKYELSFANSVTDDRRETTVGAKPLFDYLTSEILKAVQSAAAPLTLEAVEQMLDEQFQAPVDSRFSGSFGSFRALQPFNITASNEKQSNHSNPALDDAGVDVFMNDLLQLLSDEDDKEVLERWFEEFGRVAKQHNRSSNIRMQVQKERGVWKVAFVRNGQRITLDEENLLRLYFETPMADKKAARARAIELGGESTGIRLPLLELSAMVNESNTFGVSEKNGDVVYWLELHPKAAAAPVTAPAAPAPVSREAVQPATPRAPPTETSPPANRTETPSAQPTGPATPNVRSSAPNAPAVPVPTGISAAPDPDSMLPRLKTLKETGDRAAINFADLLLALLGPSSGRIFTANLNSLKSLLGAPHFKQSPLLEQMQALLAECKVILNQKPDSAAFADRIDQLATSLLGLDPYFDPNSVPVLIEEVSADFVSVIESILAQSFPWLTSLLNELSVVVAHATYLPSVAVNSQIGDGRGILIDPVLRDIPEEHKEGARLMRAMILAHETAQLALRGDNPNPSDLLNEEVVLFFGLDLAFWQTLSAAQKQAFKDYALWLDAKAERNTARFALGVERLEEFAREVSSESSWSKLARELRQHAWLNTYQYKTAAVQQLFRKLEEIRSKPSAVAQNADSARSPLKRYFDYLPHDKYLGGVNESWAVIINRSKLNAFTYVLGQFDHVRVQINPDLIPVDATAEDLIQMMLNAKQRLLEQQASAGHRVIIPSDLETYIEDTLSALEMIVAYPYMDQLLGLLDQKWSFRRGPKSWVIGNLFVGVSDRGASRYIVADSVPNDAVLYLPVMKKLLGDKFPSELNSVLADLVEKYEQDRVEKEGLLKTTLVAAMFGSDVLPGKIEYQYSTPDEHLPDQWVRIFSGRSLLKITWGGDTIRRFALFSGSERQFEFDFVSQRILSGVKTWGNYGFTPSDFKRIAWDPTTKTIHFYIDPSRYQAIKNQSESGRVLKRTYDPDLQTVSWEFHEETETSKPSAGSMATSLLGLNPDHVRGTEPVLTAEVSDDFVSVLESLLAPTFPWLKPLLDSLSVALMYARDLPSAAVNRITEDGQEILLDPRLQNAPSTHKEGAHLMRAMLLAHETAQLALRAQRPSPSDLLNEEVALFFSVDVVFWNKLTSAQQEAMKRYAAYLDEQETKDVKASNANKHPNNDETVDSDRFSLGIEQLETFADQSSEIGWKNLGQALRMHPWLSGYRLDLARVATLVEKIQSIKDAPVTTATPVSNANASPLKRFFDAIEDGGNMVGGSYGPLIDRSAPSIFTFVVTGGKLRVQINPDRIPQDATDTSLKRELGFEQKRFERTLPADDPLRPQLRTLISNVSAQLTHLGIFCVGRYMPTLLALLDSTWEMGYCNTWSVFIAPFAAVEEREAATKFKMLSTNAFSVEPAVQLGAMKLILGPLFPQSLEATLQDLQDKYANENLSRKLRDNPLVASFLNDDVFPGRTEYSYTEGWVSFPNQFSRSLAPGYSLRLVVEPVEQSRVTSFGLFNGDAPEFWFNIGGGVICGTERWDYMPVLYPNHFQRVVWDAEQKKVHFYIDRKAYDEIKKVSGTDLLLETDYPSDLEAVSWAFHPTDEAPTKSNTAPATSLLGLNPDFARGTEPVVQGATPTDFVSVLENVLSPTFPWLIPLLESLSVTLMFAKYLPSVAVNRVTPDGKEILLDPLLADVPAAHKDGADLMRAMILAHETAQLALRAEEPNPTDLLNEEVALFFAVDLEFWKGLKPAQKEALTRYATFLDQKEATGFDRFMLGMARLTDFEKRAVNDATRQLLANGLRAHAWLASSRLILERVQQLSQKLLELRKPPVVVSVSPESTNENARVVPLKRYLSALYESDSNWNIRYVPIKGLQDASAVMRTNQKNSEAISVNMPQASSGVLFLVQINPNLVPDDVTASQLNEMLQAAYEKCEREVGKAAVRGRFPEGLADVIDTFKKHLAGLEKLCAHPYMPELLSTWYGGDRASLKKQHLNFQDEIPQSKVGSSLYAYNEKERTLVVNPDTFGSRPIEYFEILKKLLGWDFPESLTPQLFELRAKYIYETLRAQGLHQLPLVFATLEDGGLPGSTRYPDPSRSLLPNIWSRRLDANWDLRMYLNANAQIGSLSMQVKSSTHDNGFEIDFDSQKLLFKNIKASIPNIRPADFQRVSWDSETETFHFYVTPDIYEKILDECGLGFCQHTGNPVSWQFHPADDVATSLLGLDSGYDRNSQVVLTSDVDAEFLSELSRLFEQNCPWLVALIGELAVSFFYGAYLPSVAVNQRTEMGNEVLFDQVLKDIPAEHRHAADVLKMILIAHEVAQLKLRDQFQSQPKHLLTEEVALFFGVDIPLWKQLSSADKAAVRALASYLDARPDIASNRFTIGVRRLDRLAGATVNAEIVRELADSLAQTAWLSNLEFDRDLYDRYARALRVLAREKVTLKRTSSGWFEKQWVKVAIEFRFASVFDLRYSREKRLAKNITAALAVANRGDLDRAQQVIEELFANEDLNLHIENVDGRATLRHAKPGFDHKRFRRNLGSEIQKSFGVSLSDDQLNELLISLAGDAEAAKRAMAMLIIDSKTTPVIRRRLRWLKSPVAHQV